MAEPNETPTPAPADPVAMLTEDQRTAYFTPSHPRHQEMIDMVQRHFGRIHGDAQAAETRTPEPVDPFGWMDKHQRAAYFNKSVNPDLHDQMVREQFNRTTLAQKQAADAELEKMGGKDAIPPEEQTPQVELPPLAAGREWDEGAAAAAIAVAEQAGIPTELVQEAIDVIAKTGAPPMSADEGEAILRAKYGEKYGSILAAANAVLRDFPAMRDWLIGSGYANDPGLILWLAQKGGERGKIQQQIDELSASDAYRQGGHPRHDETVERVRLLYKKLYT